MDAHLSGDVWRMRVLFLCEDKGRVVYGALWLMFVIENK